jgi:hypothetical protein
MQKKGVRAWNGSFALQNFKQTKKFIEYMGNAGHCQSDAISANTGIRLLRLFSWLLSLFGSGSITSDLLSRAISCVCPGRAVSLVSRATSNTVW